MKKRIANEPKSDTELNESSDESPEIPAKESNQPVSDDEEIERKIEDQNEPFMLDFDIMMQQKKEENRKLHNKRRKTKDIDMINDNDDAIAKLMADMRMAAHEDRELNQKVNFTITHKTFLSDF